MANTPSPRADQLRAMREARYEAEQKRATTAQKPKRKPKPEVQKAKAS